MLFVLFLFWPVLSALRTSLFDESLVGGSSWAGLSNYAELLDDPDFWAAMWHTALFTLLSVPPLVLLPLALALLVSRVRRLLAAGSRSSRPSCYRSRSSCWCGTGSTSRASA